MKLWLIWFCCLILLVHCAKAESQQTEEVPAPKERYPVHTEGVLHNGALIRGSLHRKEVALIFSAHAYADGMAAVQKTLADAGIPGSFFLTGDLYRNTNYHELMHQLHADGHYLGAHSDTHICYVDWRNSNRLHFTKEQLYTDISNNYREMERFGVDYEDAPYFLPPYEMYSRELVNLCRDIGLILISMTPGSYTFLDYTVPGGRYYSNAAIYRGIRSQHSRDPHGLNGYIFLIHISTDAARQEKLYNELDIFLDFLNEHGYKAVRLHELFRE